MDYLLTCSLYYIPIVLRVQVSQGALLRRGLRGGEGGQRGARGGRGLALLHVRGLLLRLWGLLVLVQGCCSGVQLWEDVAWEQTGTLEICTTIPSGSVGCPTVGTGVYHVTDM